MDLQHIRNFLELARELHFWKTSEKMFITQSALSRQIKNLEVELGIMLFERTKRSVKLTEAGKFYYEKWDLLIKEIEGIHTLAKKIDAGKYGTITIGYPGSIIYGYLPNFLKRVAQDMPELKIELVEPTDITFDQMLLAYQMDLGFRRQAADNPTLESLELYSENFALVVPFNHPVNEKNFSSLKEVSNDRFILSRLDQKTLFVETLHDIFAASGFTPTVSIESDYGAAILSMVSKGLGVSVLPYSYAFSNFPGVKFIKLPQQISLFAICRKEDHNPVLKNLINLTKETAMRQF